MSKLVEKLHQTSRVSTQPLGFKGAASTSTQKNSPMVLITVLPEGDASAAVQPLMHFHSGTGITQSAIGWSPSAEGRKPPYPFPLGKVGSISFHPPYSISVILSRRGRISWRWARCRPSLSPYRDCFVASAPRNDRV